MGRTLEALLEQEKPEVVAIAKEKAASILLGLRLAELRKQAKFTQSELASALGVRQPTIASMEREGQDILLSSLKKYVEAMGGKLSLDVEMPDGRHMGFNL
jgi:transcriptional regulator with XRE-family HTH domain